MFWTWMISIHFLFIFSCVYCSQVSSSLTLYHLQFLSGSQWECLCFFNINISSHSYTHQQHPPPCISRPGSVTLSHCTLILYLTSQLWLGSDTSAIVFVLLCCQWLENWRSEIYQRRQRQKERSCTWEKSKKYNLSEKVCKIQINKPRIEKK